MTVDAKLAEFLAAQSRPEGVMTFAELYGYIFVIACSPVEIEFDEWFGLIFNESDPNYASLDEARWVSESIFSIYSEIKAKVVAGQVALPEWCQFIEPAEANFERNLPLTFWAKGMVEGHDWLADVWRAYLTPKLDGEMSACLMVLSFFSDKNLAQAYCEEYSHVIAGDIDEMAQTAVDTFDHAMKGYARVGQTLAKQIAKSSAAKANRAAEEVNLCVCGSGKPFKSCCLH